MKTQFQRGFTLIELVVVIILLGILAAVAAPKFMNLKSDAVIANLKNLEGTLKSVNSLVYAKAVIDSQDTLNPGEVDHHGVKIATTVGYVSAINTNIPKAIEGSFAELVNATETFTEDWGIYNIPSSGVFIFPQGYDITSNCNLRYLVTAGVSDPAFYVLTTSGC